MAAVNAGNKFTLVDIGAAGRQSDGGVFVSSNFGAALNNGSLNLPPPPQKLSEDEQEYPFVFVWDEAFPLKKKFNETISKK